MKDGFPLSLLSFWRTCSHQFIASTKQQLLMKRNTLRFLLLVLSEWQKIQIKDSFFYP